MYKDVTTAVLVGTMCIYFLKIYLYYKVSIN